MGTGVGARASGLRFAESPVCMQVFDVRVSPRVTGSGFRSPCVVLFGLGFLERNRGPAPPRPCARAMGGTVGSHPSEDVRVALWPGPVRPQRGTGRGSLTARDARLQRSPLRGSAPRRAHAQAGL